MINNDIEVEEALDREDLLFIDVRSPKEFERESIPGAVNLPLFSNEEQHELGLTYKESGFSAARIKGIEFAGKRLSEMVEDLLRISAGKTPLIYCWRGGLRSQSFYQILNIAGIHALRLNGGYKAYRRYVYSTLKGYSLSPQPVILHGLTGTGKTAIIQELQKKGYPAIDLQNMALHRGSVFGKIGYKNNRSQKDFEALLVSELNKYQESPFIFLEKEGKKIGPITLPRLLTDAMEDGIHILLEAPLEVRAKRILAEYMKNKPSNKEKEQFITAIKSITPYLGKEKIKKLIDLFREENYYDVVIILCRDYYDKYYKDARRNRYIYNEIVDTSSTEKATAIIAAKAKSFIMKEEVIP